MLIFMDILIDFAFTLAINVKLSVLSDEYVRKSVKSVELNGTIRLIGKKQYHSV